MKDRWIVPLFIIAVLINVLPAIIPIDVQQRKWILWGYMTVCFLRIAYMDYTKTKNWFYIAFYAAVITLLFWLFFIK